MRTSKWMTLALAFGMSGALAMAQKPWQVTPEAGLVVNKENTGAPVELGFKAGVGVYYQIKESLGMTKPSFGLKSGLFVLQQKGGYNAMSAGSIPVGDGYYMDGSSNDVTRYYLQLPVMAAWGFKLCDDVQLNLAVGPYVGVGIAGKGHLYYTATAYEDGVTDYKHEHHDFNPFEGKQVNDEYRIEASPRFDWGGTASAGITVKRVSFSIGYDIAFGDLYEKQNDLRVRNHMVSFTFGYTL